MEYFMMEQDKRLRHPPMIRMPSGFNRIQGMDENAPLILYVDNLGLTCQYSDYLLQPFPMIGEDMQKIMRKYQSNIRFRQVILVDKKKGLQHVYYGMTVPEMDCVFTREWRNAMGQGTELVLDMSRVKEAKIFQAKQPKEKLFVCLDVAESILRREPEGIWFTPVQAANGADIDK